MDRSTAVKDLAMLAGIGGATIGALTLPDVGDQLWLVLTAGTLWSWGALRAQLAMVA